MFEDQVGKIDWYQQHIGKISSATFHSSAQQRLALVATESSVVAALDLRTNAIIWRQVLQAEEKLATLQLHGRTLLSLGITSEGGYLRAWTLTGEQVWDAHISPPAAAATSTPQVAVAPSGAVLVVWGDVVSAYTLTSGHALWQWTAAADGAPAVSLQQAVLGATDAERFTACGIAFSGGKQQLFVAEVSVKDGAEIERKLVPVGGAGDAAASPALMATLDRKFLVMSAGRALTVYTAAAEQIFTHSLDAALPSLQRQPADAKIELLPIALPGVIALRLPSSSALLKITRDGASLEILREVESDDHHYAHITSRDGKALLALVQSLPGGDSVELEVAQISEVGDCSDWEKEGIMKFDQTEHGRIEAVFLNSYSKKEGGFGHRLLVTAEDHSLHVTQPSKDGAAQGWTREEALASVSGVEMLHFPPPLAADEEEAEETRPSFAWVVPSLIASVQRRITGALAPPPSSTSTVEPAPHHADAYGTRQVMIVRTDAPKLFGLHSSDGHVIWSHFVPPLKPGERSPKLVAHFVCSGGGAAPHALVVAQGPSSWSVRELHPFSGKLLGESHGEGSLLHAAKLSVDSELTRPPLMLVTSELKVLLFPDTPAARRALHAQVHDTFFYLLRPGEFSLSGYGLSVADAAADPGGASFVATQRWGMMLPSGDGDVPPQVELSSFPYEGAIHSPVKTLGDRSVLHKYINKNALALALALPAGEGEAAVEILVVDSVSGRVIHTARHAGCQGPLNVLLGENWLVYQYWDPKFLHYQIASTEFFANVSFADDLLSLVLAGPADYSQRDNMFDSFSPAAASTHTRSQAYGFSTALAAMTVTQTAAGITPKSVLALTAAGQLLSLDKRLLDPRRPLVDPKQMSQQDREEGLLPYSNTLGGINPLSVVSHQHTIARPRLIVSSPTLLESTSLGLAVGIDLFLTRVTPAREFDRLNEDFNFIALVGATVFLLVATLGSGCYSSKKELVKAWR